MGFSFLPVTKLRAWDCKIKQSFFLPPATRRLTQIEVTVLVLLFDLKSVRQVVHQTQRSKKFLYSLPPKNTITPPTKALSKPCSSEENKLNLIFLNIAQRCSHRDSNILYGTFCSKYFSKTSNPKH